MEDLINHDIEYLCIREIKNNECYDITLRDYRELYFQKINECVKYLDKKDIKSILKPYGNKYKLLKRYMEAGQDLDYLFEDTEWDFYSRLLIWYIEEKITNEKITCLWEHMREVFNKNDKEESEDEEQQEEEEQEEEEED